MVCYGPTFYLFFYRWLALWSDFLCMFLHIVCHGQTFNVFFTDGLTYYVVFIDGVLWSDILFLYFLQMVSHGLDILFLYFF